MVSSRFSMCLGLLTCSVFVLGLSACSDDASTPSVAGSSTGGGDSAGGSSSTTGGTGATGTGATGTGAGPTAGTGGSDAATAATGGADGAGTDTCAAQNLLGEDGFVVDLTTGIVGPWYTFGGTGAEFTPPNGEKVVPTDGKICFSGTNTAVTDGRYAENFGAQLALDLCAMPGGDVMDRCEEWLPPDYCTKGWAAETKHTITDCGITVNSVSFDLSGTITKTAEPLRVTFWELERDESPYVVIKDHPAAGGESHQELQASTATVGFNPAAPAQDHGQIAGIRFHAASTGSDPIEWNFCISNLCIK